MMGTWCKEKKKFPMAKSTVFGYLLYEGGPEPHQPRTLHTICPGWMFPSGMAILFPQGPTYNPGHKTSDKRSPFSSSRNNSSGEECKMVRESEGEFFFSPGASGKFGKSIRRRVLSSLWRHDLTLYDWINFPLADQGPYIPLQFI